ncbi:MAG: GntR family transcriptional regulator, partial [Stellaceae bacterium]
MPGPSSRIATSGLQLDAELYTNIWPRIIWKGPGRKKDRVGRQARYIGRTMPKGPKPKPRVRSAGRRSSGASERAGRLYDSLRGMIVRGQLAPGARIVETEVAERFGVSRTPVRAAFQRLEREGYV